MNGSSDLECIQILNDCFEINIWFGRVKKLSHRRVVHELIDYVYVYGCESLDSHLKIIVL